MAASIASTNRDEALDKVYEEIEKDLIVSFNLCNFLLDIPNRIGNFITFYYSFDLMLEREFQLQYLKLVRWI